MNSPAVLIVPVCERGQGGGHLSRSLLLLRALQARGRDAYLWIPEHLKDDFLQRFREFFNAFDHPSFLSREEDISGHNWGFIVLDRFRTSRKEFAFWSGIAPLIGIDEGGPFRNRFDFLIDILPSLLKTQANISNPGLLPLPHRRRPAAALGASKESAAGSAPLRVLVSFGAEDAAGLGFQAARALSRSAAKSGRASSQALTLIVPIPPHNASGEQREISGVKIVGKIPNLREQLAEYDLLVTHFGLGAFEAIYARLPVILLSPTRYHHKLARNAGFFCLGAGAGAVRRLGRLSLDGVLLETLGKRGGEIARRFGLEEDQKEDISSFIGSFSPHSSRHCPLCGEKTAPYFGALPALARFPEASYRRCRRCGMVFQIRLKPPPIEYNKDYFFESYKKQYGKTYLEDFPGLKEMGRKRLVHIQALLNLPPDLKPSILDVGCAYGPFLAAAAECGFSVVGVEPAEDAVRYVQEELRFTAWLGSFPGALPAPESVPARFDAITLWYVIEHFEEPGEILREIHRLLKDGGVLAFSTPSFSGISGRKNLRAFLKNSPQDHHTIWSPRSCRKVLEDYGFRLRKIVVTGHHPERFPLLGRFARPAKKGVLYKLLLFISRLFRLGDTFEAYAVKI